jgi:hypothetical protein
MRSVGGEDFSISIQEMQKNVKHKLHESSGKYKQRVDIKRRQVDF